MLRLLLLLAAISSSGCMMLTQEYATVRRTYHDQDFQALSLIQTGNRDYAVCGSLSASPGIESHLLIDIPVQKKLIEQTIAESSAEAWREWLRSFSQGPGIYIPSNDGITERKTVVVFSDIMAEPVMLKVSAPTESHDYRWLAIVTIPADLVTTPIQAIYVFTHFEG